MQIRPAIESDVAAVAAIYNEGIEDRQATNAASLAAHVACGFREVGIQYRHGRLDGEWKDCVLVDLLLGDAARGER
jgi:L-amino acid N-acyltransferase YncA